MKGKTKVELHDCEIGPVLAGLELVRLLNEGKLWLTFEQQRELLHIVTDCGTYPRGEYFNEFLDDLKEKFL